MQAEGNDPHTNYAPADFSEAVQDRPPQSIATAVTNVSLYHSQENSEKINQAKVWRKKVRDILQNHQERILQFFTKPLPTDHPMKVAHSLLTKYGKNISQNFDSHRTPPQLFKDFLKDPSGNGFLSLNQYIGDLEKARAADSPTQRWSNMTRSLLDYMRNVGDELLRIDQKLQSECNLLDTVVEKVIQLTNLGNPGVEGFEELMESYIDKQFESHPIEELYWDYINTVQKYSGLRDILMPQRTANITEPVCCICMTEVAILAFTPCGHTFCTNCSKKTSVCHICRQVVSNRIRLFFG